MESKYSNFLTILLVIIIVAIITILGFLGYNYYENYVINNKSEEFVDSFINEVTNNKNNTSNTTDNNNSNDNSIFDGVEQGNNTNSNGQNSQSKPQYNNYDMVGTIEIPATNVKYVVLDSSALSKKGLETSVIAIYGDINQVGNTTIIGHNYRNGVFFSNNKKLNIGDKVYITDLSGQRLAYTIYNKYETDENDSEYMTRDTKGAREISLSTCTDDSKARLVIWAKADLDT